MFEIVFLNEYPLLHQILGSVAYFEQCDKPQMANNLLEHGIRALAACSLMKLVQYPLNNSSPKYDPVIIYSDLLFEMHIVFFSLVEHIRRYFADCLSSSFPYNKI